MASKQTIRTFVILTLAFDAISFILSYTFTSSTGASAQLTGFFALGGGVLTIVTLVMALIRQFRLRQWGWLICTLLFGYLCLVIYLFVTPETPQRRARSGYYPIQQIYQPMQPYQPSSTYQPEPYRDPTPQREEPVQQYEPQSYQEATDPEFYLRQKPIESNQEQNAPSDWQRSNQE